MQSLSVDARLHLQLTRDFPAWQTVYRYFRTWRKDGTWLRLHDRLRAWVRVADRSASPSEAIVDSQSVKAAMVKQAVGYDAGKQIKGRKRFLTVVGTHPAGLCYGSECGGVKGQTSSPTSSPDGKRSISAAYHLGRWWVWWWTLYAVGDHGLRLDCPSRAATRTDQRVCVAEKTLDGWTDFRLVDGLSSISQGLWTIARKLKALIYLAMIRLMLRRLA